MVVVQFGDDIIFWVFFKRWEFISGMIRGISFSSLNSEERSMEMEFFAKGINFLEISLPAQKKIISIGVSKEFFSKTFTFRLLFLKEIFLF